MNSPDKDPSSVSGVDEGAGAATVTIYIDRNGFTVPRRALTGNELRQLAIPPIGSECDLFQVSEGSEEDLLVSDQEVIELTPNVQFFSAPRMIMAGQRAADERGRGASN